MYISIYINILVKFYYLYPRIAERLSMYPLQSLGLACREGIGGGYWGMRVDILPVPYAIFWGRNIEVWKVLGLSILGFFRGRGGRGKFSKRRGRGGLETFATCNCYTI